MTDFAVQPSIWYPPGSLAGQQVANVSQTAASYTFGPFAANTFSRLQFTVNHGAQALSSIALTGMTAATFKEGLFFILHASPTTPQCQDNNAAPGNTMVIGGTSATGKGSGWIYLPAAPDLKTWQFDHFDSIAARRFWGECTDAANNPTAVVFTFAASVAHNIKIWGWN